MDHLRDSVSLRGYGQRDPLQEYKKEAYRLFENMMGRIYDETTQAMLFFDASQVANTQLEADEPDESELTFKHPDALPVAQNEPPGAPPGRAQTSEDGMIYHGSRSGGETPARTAPQTQRRSAEKVGRNDPCPCGSGKKYKKCHGALEAVD
jgi:preprotein translocase subunit SecA